jgi:hypothetical protein
MRLLHRFIVVFACTSALAAIGSAPAQASRYEYVGLVGGYGTWMDPSTCTSGGHHCKAFQHFGPAPCKGSYYTRSGYYDDVFVRFDPTQRWHC